MRLRNLLVFSILAAIAPIALAQVEPVDPLWLEQAEQQIRSAEYEIGEQEGRWQAPNRAHNLRTHFEPKGIEVQRRDEQEASWSWTLSLVGCGRGAEIEPVEEAQLNAEGRRIDYDRGELVEWYVNSEEGVEQGFTLTRSPSRGTSPAALVMELGGDLSAVVASDGQAIDFRAPGGATVIRYDKLLVNDATGRRLDAWLEASLRDGRREVRILFDDQGAVYPVVVDPLATSPAWTAEADQVSARLGYTVATAGDVNGDGYSDVLVGAYTYDNGESDEGRAFVYLGSASGLSATHSWSGEGNQADAYYGIALSTAGDVNGDGYSDIVVGASNFDGALSTEGRAFVYYGSPGGPSILADWSVAGGQAVAFFARAVGTAGDVDGDGYSDLLIGAINYNGTNSGSGSAFLYRGSASGLSTTPDWVNDGDGQSGSQYGFVTTLAGDVNGDGFSDVLIGAYAHDDVGGGGEGRLFVYHGSASGLSATADWEARGDQLNANLGYSASTAGDVNGDGYADIIAGAYRHDNGQGDEGRAYLYLGSASGLPGGPVALPGDADWSFESDQVGARLGISVSTAGDVNGDGYADVVVGADRFDAGSGDEGRIFLFLGSSTGPSAVADWTAESDQNAANLGRSVSIAGDVNGDGYSDILAGAPLFNNGQTDEGRAYVYFGAPNGLAATAGELFLGSSSEDYFGNSVASAGDVNGDGLADLLIGAYGEDPVLQDEGRAYLYLGAEGGMSTTPAWSYAGSQQDQYVGTAVASAGDVNGDGYGDVVLGVGWFDDGAFQDEGRALVFHGSSLGLSATPDATLECGLGGSFNYCGFSVASGGDVNGDGFGDVVVGAPYVGSSDEGAAYLFHGSASGLDTNAAWSFLSTRNLEHFGYSVSTAGDVNGDGFADVVISTDVIGDSSSFGTNKAASLFHGGPSGLALEASGILAAVYYYGSKEEIRVADAGDVNGDGFADVIVGEPRRNFPEQEAGRASLHLGSASGISGSSAWTFEGVDAYERVGWSVDGAGDVNGDGFADIVVGKPSFPFPSPTESGELLLFYGSATGPATAPDELLTIAQLGAFLGSSVAGLGDVDGDGYSDIAVGASYFDNVGLDEGRVAVHYGNGGPGVSLKPQQRRTDGLTAISPNGWSDSGTGFRLLTTGRTPFGSSRVKLESEIKPFGTPFDGVSTTTTASWVETGAVGALLDELVDGLQPGDRVHWRVRLLYDPATSPYQQASRWFTQPWDGAEESDLRTPAFADVSVTLTADLDVLLEGQQVTYEVQVQNAGPDDTAVSVDGTLHSTVDSITPSQGSCLPAAGSSSILDCDLGIVPSGGMATVQIVITATTGTKTTTVSVGGAARDDDSSNNSAMVTTIVRRLEIGDRVWEDLNGNGIQDVGEPGLAGALVLLFRDSGSLITTVTTVSSGDYSFRCIGTGNFCYVEPGESYYVRYIPPAGYTLTVPNQGTDDLMDSDADLLTQSTPIFSVVDSDDPDRWDAGMIPICTTPDEPIYIYDMRLTSDGNDYSILDFQDPNQPSERTGYNVYRASNPTLTSDPASLFATDIVDMDEATPNAQWVDTSGDISPSGVWYYQITAVNSRCPVGSDEGPF